MRCLESPRLACKTNLRLEPTNPRPLGREIATPAPALSPRRNRELTGPRIVLLVPTGRAIDTRQAIGYRPGELNGI